MRLLFNYFLRGLLFILPVAATLYIIILLVNWANDLFNELLFSWSPIYIPGLGLLTAAVLIISLGFLVSRVVTQPFFNFLERVMGRTPLIKIVYSVLKDLTEAFVGDRKKFNKPALVTFIDGIERIGFVTDGDLGIAEIENRVTVYFPHSYNFSGNLFLVAPDRIKRLDINPADAMKFVVSAGITRIEEEL
ncbi:MAG: DUF502 domain-containing protein [Balneolaceae bacterium]